MPGLLIFLGLGLVWSWKAAGVWLLVWAALAFVVEVILDL